jgi:hypothetical protein
MPAESAQDRLNMLRVEDFGIEVAYNGGTIFGIFDREPVDAGVGGVSINAQEVIFLARTADVPVLVNPTSPPTRMPIGPIDGVDYSINRWEDENGMTRLYLVRNDG